MIYTFPPTSSIDNFNATGINLIAKWKWKWKSKSKLLYDWRSISQYVLVSSTLVGLETRYYFLSECCCLTFTVLFLCGALSDERTGQQFAVSELLRTRNHTLRLIWLPQSGGPGSRIYIPQEQGGSIIPPGTGFPLRRLIRFASYEFSPYSFVVFISWVQ
jgi:hypothetical protein